MKLSDFIDSVGRQRKEAVVNVHDVLIPWGAATRQLEADSELLDALLEMLFKNDNSWTNNSFNFNYFVKRDDTIHYKVQELTEYHDFELNELADCSTPREAIEVAVRKFKEQK